MPDEPRSRSMLAPSKQDPTGLYSFLDVFDKYDAKLAAEFRKYLFSLPENAQAGIVSNMRSRRPDEQMAYARSLVHP